ncbi:2-succinyl-6-hydroxy-2,4-cyclohexadiene-1-carboxylate synthase [Vibrio sp. F74]|uniref:2-succinyl-6-hydroxy-2, 4-cyclohexadiene-1-carboxylate synthase n=1 Tax=Vibrio sp. F74 TaxID=700020 RepID=UPI0035F572B8
MLHISQFQEPSTNSEQPVLVFLHGLLGNGSDWQEVINRLDQYPCLAVDLPCHGYSCNRHPVSFSHTCQLIFNTILSQVGSNRSIIIVGYSLGARLAMFGLANGTFDGLNIVGYFLEGGNFGLIDENERQQRRINDRRWAERFKCEPIEQVLSDWYQQAVFSSLNREQRDELIARRAHNKGSAIAEMLVTTSLGNQPYLLDKIVRIGKPVHYICGEKDMKFFELAKQSKLSFTSIKEAGHNVHKEQPEEFAQLIRTKLIQLEQTL